MVLREDAACSAFGRVVFSAGRLTFEPPLPRALVFYGPGREPAPRPSGLGVAVRGVDTNRLLGRRDKEGAYEGWATLTGAWRNGLLDVDDQRPERPHHRSEEIAWTAPPCREPSGGWPAGGELELPDAHEALVLARTVVASTIFRPVDRGPVLVVAASDPQLVADELVPLLGGRVCIVKTRYTAQEVDAVRHEIDANFEAWQACTSGTTSDSGGQVLLTLELVRVVPEVVERASAWPGHLVAVRPWLTPVA